jgi:signal transduction histidine kinase
MLDDATLAGIRAAVTGHLRDFSPLDGRDSFTGFHTLDAGGLVVLAELSASEQLAPERWQARIIQVGAGLIVLLCAATLAGYLVRRHRTETRAALAAAEAARAELEALLAGLPVAAYQGRVAPDGDYSRRYLSPNIKAITGWTPTELAAPADWDTRMEHDGGVSFLAFFRDVLHDGSGTIEYRLRRPDGGIACLSECARIAVRLPDGGAEVVGTIADVTAERELATQAAMTSKLSMLGEMASGMAHELIQPVTAISLGAELASSVLRREPVEAATIARTLETIARESRRAGEIIDQLRLFGRADQGPPGPVRLDAAVQGALTLVAGLLRDATIEFFLEIAPDLPPVLGRLVPIEQVLVNLCMNARDALLTRPTGARRLTISAAANGESVRVRVADTGGGLPPAVLARLFEPFVTTKPAGVGTGLGLSICLRLMRGFGGDIAARNTDSGAEFFLTFRAAPDETVAASVSGDHAE